MNSINYSLLNEILLQENYDAFKPIETTMPQPLVRKRSSDDISAHEEAINKIIQRLSCQSPIPSNEYIKYKKTKDDYSIAELSENEYDYELSYSSDENDIKIWPFKKDIEECYRENHDEYYEQLYQEEYEEYYKDDVSDAGYCSYDSP
jgi:hypothetical protein